MSEENIVRYTLEELKKMKGETDWNRVRNQTEDAPFDDDDFEVDWSSAKMVYPEPKSAVSLRIDPDILSFFKSEGKGYQTRINAVLRTYVEARKRQAP